MWPCSHCRLVEIWFPWCSILCCPPLMKDSGVPKCRRENLCSMLHLLFLCWWEKKKWENFRPAESVNEAKLNNNKAMHLSVRAQHDLLAKGPSSDVQLCCCWRNVVMKISRVFITASISESLISQFSAAWCLVWMNEPRECWCYFMINV